MADASGLSFGTASILSVCFLLACAISWITTKWMIRLAPRLGLVDEPAARKVHVRTTPLGGGAAIFVGVTATLGIVVLAAWLVEGRILPIEWLPEAAVVHAAGVLSRASLLGLIAAAATIQFLLGLADDWRDGGLSYQLRLGIEVLLVAGLITQGICLSLFVPSLWLTAPVTVLWIVGLTNAINFLDNVDALAGGISFCACGFFAGISFLIGNWFIAGCFFVTMGAILGFLRFNWNPAKIFMGDAGSNFLGFWIGTLTVIATFSEARFSHVTVFAPLCILAVPLYDSTSVILIRLRQGRSPFQPDKQHFSHRLMALGLSPKQAVLVIYFVAITTGIGGVLLFYVFPPAAPLVLIQVGFTLGVIAILEVVSKRIVERNGGEEKNIGSGRVDP